MGTLGILSIFPSRLVTLQPSNSSLQIFALAATMAERLAKLQKLHSFRQKLPKMSKTALAAVLKEVQESGPPELQTTKSMLEAQRSVLSQHNAYGDLILTVNLTATDGSTKPTLVVNGLSYLHAAISQGGAMTDAITSLLSTHKCDAEHP